MNNAVAKDFTHLYQIDWNRYNTASNGVVINGNGEFDTYNGIVSHYIGDVEILER